MAQPGMTRLKSHARQTETRREVNRGAVRQGCILTLWTGLVDEGRLVEVMGENLGLACRGRS